MGLLYVIVDGVEYRVPIEYPSLSRSFDYVQGGQGGTMQSGLETLDTIGTRYSYSLHIPENHKAPAEYDALYEVLSAPDREHLITLPYGQTSMTFWAKVEGGSDTLFDPFRGYKRWGDLTVKFVPLRPQRP